MGKQFNIQAVTGIQYLGNRIRLIKYLEVTLGGNRKIT